MQATPRTVQAVLWSALAGIVLSGTGQARAAPAQAASGATLPDVVFEGACDASGAVTLGALRFLVADDEDNVLRVYDAARGGPPVVSADLSPGLDLPAKKKWPETDLEAATRLGDDALWLSSHGRSSGGKRQQARLRFFATSAPTDGRGVKLLGTPYTGLLDDLLRAPALGPFDLRRAETLAPKAPGGLNIEGMTARPDGRSVIIGFRNPLARGRAIVLPILNPGELARGNGPTVFGDPILLDLDQRGIRSISYWRGRYLLVGGGIAHEKPSLLYSWDGKSERPTPVASADLADLNPEGFATWEDRDQIMVLSDDGERSVAGEPCKKVKDPRKKTFRGRWVPLPSAPR